MRSTGSASAATSISDGVRVEDRDAALVELRREAHRLEELRSAVDPRGRSTRVVPLRHDLDRERRPRQDVHAHDGGIERAARLSTFETTTVVTPRRSSSARVPDDRIVVEEISVARPVERGVPVGAEEQAAVRPQTRCRGLTEEEGSTEPPLGDVSADGIVGREARHQGNRDLGSRAVASRCVSRELHLEEAPPVDCLHHGLHLAAEPGRHAAREHDHRHRPRPEGVRPGLDGLVEPRLPGRRQGDAGRTGSGGSTAPWTACSASRSRPVDEPPAKPFEGGGVEPVAFECCARLGIDLVEDHLELTGAGSEVA